jgi:hypothetical protein
MYLTWCASRYDADIFDDWYTRCFEVKKHKLIKLFTSALIIVYIVNMMLGSWIPPACSISNLEWRRCSGNFQVNKAATVFLSVRYLPPQKSSRFLYSDILTKKCDIFQSMWYPLSNVGMIIWTVGILLFSPGWLAAARF